MIGSLADFITIDNDIFAEHNKTNREEDHLSPQVIKRRGKSTFESYVPQDKTDLLIRYERNNIFNINRKKYNSIAKEAHSKQRIKKPLYQHRSFFVKPDIARDYIAKEELKRKHNLLRAILRMKQSQQQPKGQSDYEQSFQRLYSGYRSIHPEPILSNNQEINMHQEEISNQKIVSMPPLRNMNSLSNKKRLQFENCLHWAKKHQKNGDFFAKQLGKYQQKESNQGVIMNRSLIDEISKKIQFNLTD